MMWCEEKVQMKQWFKRCLGWTAFCEKKKKRPQLKIFWIISASFCFFPFRVDSARERKPMSKTHRKREDLMQKVSKQSRRTHECSSSCRSGRHPRWQRLAAEQRGLPFAVATSHKETPIVEDTDTAIGDETIVPEASLQVVAAPDAAGDSVHPQEDFGKPVIHQEDEIWEFSPRSSRNMPKDSCHFSELKHARTRRAMLEVVERVFPMEWPFDVGLKLQQASISSMLGHQRHAFLGNLSLCSPTTFCGMKTMPPRAFDQHRDILAVLQSG